MKTRVPVTMDKKAGSALIMLAMLLILPAGLFAADSTVILDVEKIIKKVDELYRSKSSYAEFEMEIVTPHWQRTMAMYGWTEGMDKTLLRVTSPKKEAGLATLRIENEMWNYLPRTNKVMKVPPSMMMSSWMGSDFTNDDLVKEFSLFEDYTYELVEVEDGREDMYYVKAVPREGLPVVWGHIIIAVRQGDFLPVWQKYYDEKGTLMRIWQFSDIRKFGKRTIPAVMEIIPQHKEGHKTILRYRRLEFDTEIDKDVFSLRNLRAAE